MKGDVDIMSNDEFMKKCKEIVVEYFNSQADSTDKNGKITEENVFIVWACKTLQNNKSKLTLKSAIFASMMIGGFMIGTNEVFASNEYNILNHIGYVSTTVSDGMYYEITHNGDKKEIYVDAYKKWKNYAIKY